MKNLTDFRKTVETGMDPCLRMLFTRRNEKKKKIEPDLRLGRDSKLSFPRGSRPPPHAQRDEKTYVREPYWFAICLFITEKYLKLCCGFTSKSFD